MQQHCLLRGHGPFPLGSTFFQEKPSVVQRQRHRMRVKNGNDLRDNTDNMPRPALHWYYCGESTQTALVAVQASI